MLAHGGAGEAALEGRGDVAAAQAAWWPGWIEGADEGLAVLEGDAGSAG